MERKEETFDGAGARRSCTSAVASQCAEDSLSANLSSNGNKMFGRMSSKPVSSSGSDDDISPAHNHGCTRQTERASRASSNSSLDDDMNVDDSSSNGGKAKKKKPKLDRSKLRKGKWTVEEEEYTSRIIHYFNTGLLTLPEGATLRSYLADKLNCDPMRVTKKYAGASCLGRRVYLFRDRIQPTIAEIQLAKQELDHLEQRLRLRIERGHAISPQAMPPTLPDPLFAATDVQSVMNVPTVKAQQPNAATMQELLFNLMSAQNNTNTLAAALQPAPVPWVTAATQPSSQPAHWVQPLATATHQAAPAPWVQPQAAFSQNSSQSTAQQPSALASAPIADMLQQLLLINASKNLSQPLGEVLPSPIQQALPLSQPQAPNVSPEVANWAVNQVVASLGPLLSQLTAANIQQVQQQLQSEQQKAELHAQIQEQQSRLLQQQLLQLQQQLQPDPVPSPYLASSNEKLAAELKQTYDSTLQQQEQRSQQRPAENNTFDGTQTASAAARPKFHLSSQPHHGGKQTKPRSAKDKAGGSDLLGFLSTLRQSYESALRDKHTTSGNGIHSMKRLAQVASIVESSRNSDSSSDDANPRHPLVTDSASSQRLESSAEDSGEWTSKKTDPSSSSDGGDSEKEVNDRAQASSSSDCSESEKEVNHRKQRARKESTSKGPPRKRYKGLIRQTG